MPLSEADKAAMEELARKLREQEAERKAWAEQEARDREAEARGELR